MSDNTSQTGSPDRDLISLSQVHEVQYWTKKFNISSNELEEAVNAVGNSAKAVEEYLDKR